MPVELNPYSCEIPGNLFVGYAGLRETIAVGLMNKRNYALFGGHRCGKTSFLLQLETDIRRTGNAALPCYVNMKQKMPNSEMEVLLELWSGLTTPLDIEPIGEVECLTSDRNTFFGFRRLSARLEALYGANWLVIWLIDELDWLANNERAKQVLRRVIIDEPHCRHFRLVASGGPSMVPLTGHGSVLNLQPSYLGSLPLRDAGELIERGLRLTPDQRAKVCELTGRHPYLLQALLGKLWETRDEEWAAERLRRAVHDVMRDRFGSFRRWIASFGQQGCDFYRALVKVGGGADAKQLQSQLRLGDRFYEVLDVLEYHGVVEHIAGTIRACGHLFFEWFQSNIEIEQSALPQAETGHVDRSKCIFVVHGRNDRVRIALYEFLRALDLHPLEWTEIKELTEGQNPYVGDIIETGFRKAQAVVVLLTGDDEARLKKEFHGKYDGPDEFDLRPQPRPNVLFEAGIAMAKFPNSTILVQVGELRGMSDIAGRHLLRMENSRPARTELAKALRKAGCKIDIERTNRWLDSGDFGVPKDNGG